MNKITKLITLSIVLFFCVSNGFAQQHTMLNKAQEHYDKFEFVEALELYLYVAKKHPSDEVFIQVAHCYAKMNKFEEEEQWYNKVKDKAKMSPEDHYMYAQVLLADGKIKEAHKWFEYYDHEKHSDSRGARKLYTLDHLMDYYKDSLKYTITNVKDVNSEYSEFGPAYYKDGIVFVSSRFTKSPGVQREFSWDNSAFLDIYYSEGKDGKKYSTPVNFDSKINTKYHEGPLTFNKDQTKVIFTRNNYLHGHTQKSKEGHITQVDLFEAELVGEHWENIHKLDFENREYTYEHPTMSLDHKTLIFASDIPGGKGGKDLWVSKWAGTKWGKPKNLKSLNTEGNEGFPFLHEDGTLYFSSDGHGGIGGLDIYFAELKEDGEYAESVDMGYPINSHRDDFGLIINEDKTTGYFSSNRKGGVGSDDIYHFAANGSFICAKVLDEETQKPVEGVTVSIKDEKGKVLPSQVSAKDGSFELFMVKEKYYTISGKKALYEPGELKLTYDQIENDSSCAKLYVDSIEIVLHGVITSSKNKNPLDSAEVHIKNLTDGTEEIIITKSDGVFKFYSLPEKEYEIIAYRKGYFQAAKTTSTMGIDRSKTILIDLSLILEKIEKKATIKLDNITYGYNSAELSEGAKTELNKIVKTMVDNSSMKVELSSHSDCRGSASYNMKLSQKRAESAVDYLVSQGVNKANIVAKGYGESKLLNHCKEDNDCSEEEHSINRRTEIKVL